MIMKKTLLVAAASVALATPALAKDGSPYVGVEGGILFPKSQTVFGDIDFTNTANTDFTRTSVANVKYKKGYDVDLIAGYDFGMFRLEGELGYKRARAKSINVNDAFVTALNTGAGTTFTGGDFNINGKTSVLSGMVNGLVDFGGNGGPGFYAGGGVGAANVKQFGSSDTKFAWQLLAGAYMPVSNNLDVGLKYRYFRAGRSSGSDAFPFSAGATTCGALPCSGGVATFDTDSRFSSHSLLASLVYNFGGETAVAAPPPPPPAPVVEAPATQTCPDGSVILATAACPAPPPPPPPPPPATQGERG
jgi:opacity protein-like surface antigen